MATIHLFPVATPEATPDGTSESDCFTYLLYQAAIAEGERRVYARLGIPQPAFAPSPHLSLASLPSPGAAT